MIERELIQLIAQLLVENKIRPAEFEDMFYKIIDAMNEI